MCNELKKHTHKSIFTTKPNGNGVVIPFVAHTCTVVNVFWLFFLSFSPFLACLRVFFYMFAPIVCIVEIYWSQDGYHIGNYSVIWIFTIIDYLWACSYVGGMLTMEKVSYVNIKSKQFVFSTRSLIFFWESHETFPMRNIQRKRNRKSSKRLRRRKQLSYWLKCYLDYEELSIHHKTYE